jgi:hypothetical protein
MTDAILSARVKSLETQLAALKAQMSKEPTIAQKSLADLRGILKGQARSDDADIEAVEYQFTWDGESER